MALTEKEKEKIQKTVKEASSPEDYEAIYNFLFPELDDQEARIETCLATLEELKKPENSSVMMKAIFAQGDQNESGDGKDLSWQNNLIHRTGEYGSINYCNVDLLNYESKDGKTVYHYYSSGREGKIDIPEDDAIIIAKVVIGVLIKVIKIIKDSELKSLENYIDLAKTLEEETEEYINANLQLETEKLKDKVKRKITSTFLIKKYSAFLFPDNFMFIYSEDYIKGHFKLLGLPYSKKEDWFVQAGRYALKVEEIKKNAPKKSAVEIYKIVNEFRDLKLNSSESTDTESRNRIFFGAPGTGKSYQLDKEKTCKFGENYERVTFHPDYSYANFVGTYKPVSDDGGNIRYEYVPGPFMRVLYDSLTDKFRFDNMSDDEKKSAAAPTPHLLIIEEINRADVAAVFGDVFQLLDRNADGESQYKVQASEDIRRYLQGKADESELDGNIKNRIKNLTELYIPDNMYIWATMNSADQGVFPLDTAFKRRWDFTYIGVDEKAEETESRIITLGKGRAPKSVKITWNDLRKAINNKLLALGLNEDKLMGPFFISKDAFKDDDTFKKVFKSKVIMYLFDDAAKQRRQELFSSELFGADKKYNQYSEICTQFDEQGVDIFCTDISDKLRKIAKKYSGEDFENNPGEDFDEQK